MNAEQVVEKILSQARTEAEMIVNEAKEKLAAEEAQLQSEIAEFDKKTEQMAKDVGEDKLQRMLAGQRMKQAKRLLAAKVAILDDVFDKAKDVVSQLPDEKYLSLMTTMLKEAVETGDEEVIVGKNETRLNSEFIKRANRELGAGFKGNLRLSDQKADIAGGFILSRGKIRINATSEVLIDRLRESMQVELARELFST